ncbi:tetratricopeptide repeat protein [Pendulispora rubella]|uniref:Tetratricopeptide repeat protein n=1 Tax=Pendulispora rubella TaxID=2741070 RepID=A0ABZ2LCY1_9BACT
MRSCFRCLRRLTAAMLTMIALTAGAATAHADGVPPAAASPLEREQAQSLFLKGKERFDQKNYREALESFRASLAVVNSPNTRLYVGRCLQNSGDLLGAYIEFGRAATEAREASASDGRYKLTASEAAAERDGIQPELGFVTIQLNGADDSTLLRVAGQKVRGASSEAWPVLPGPVEIVVERQGAEVARRSVTVARGGRESVQIDVPPAPASPGGGPTEPTRDSGQTLRTLSFVAAGVGVAGFATFAIAGLSAKSTYDDLDSRCGGTRCREDVRDDISHGNTMQTVANIGLVVGAVGVATGITLFAIGQSKKNSSTSTLMVTTTGTGISIRGAL